MVWIRPPCQNGPDASETHSCHEKGAHCRGWTLQKSTDAVFCLYDSAPKVMIMTTMFNNRGLRMDIITNYKQVELYSTSSISSSLGLSNSGSPSSFKWTGTRSWNLECTTYREKSIDLINMLSINRTHLTQQTDADYGNHLIFFMSLPDEGIVLDSALGI